MVRIDALWCSSILYYRDKLYRVRIDPSKGLTSKFFVFRPEETVPCKFNHTR